MKKAAFVLILLSLFALGSLAPAFGQGRAPSLAALHSPGVPAAQRAARPASPRTTGFPSSPWPSPTAPGPSARSPARKAWPISWRT
ncbi:MAG: hypothetical protein M0C28_26620 [Candidatus Moduliflexus flocculans]|nr:hypothetical protein [Candidatus Moduliflexus flocculans]